MVTPNPPWVTRTLRENWDRILSHVGPQLMPRIETGGPVAWMKDRWEPVEYGTGHYGTVMPTETPDIVCKVTSDPAEGSFVAAALSIGAIPAGMIRYDRIFALPERYRDRPVFILWRQEAREVGSVIQPPMYGASRGYDGAEAYRLLLNTKAAGHLARIALLNNRTLLARVPEYEREAFEFVGERYDWLEGTLGNLEEHMPSWLKGPRRLAVLLRFFEAGAEMMEHNNALTTNIGNALAFYYEREILLADVHTGNVGRFSHDDYGPEGVIGITDPGHAVFLDNRYDVVTIPDL